MTVSGGEALTLAAVLSSVALGGAVQASCGLGLAIVALPAVMFLEPRMVPTPLLLASLALSTVVLVREHSSVDARGFGWALGARIAGTIVAVLFIPDVTGEYRWILGTILLAAAALSASDRLTLAPTPATLTFAGLLSGVMGTSTSIGGPAMGLVYRKEDLPKLRSTLAAFFIAGNVISILALAAAGRIGAVDFRLGAIAVAAVLAGEWLARPISDRVPEKTLRAAVLAVAVAGGILALVT